jgi:hypothetical protein
MSSRLCSVSCNAAPAESTDLILPCQYYDVSGSARLSGEQRLMLALLIDAINVYQRGALASAAPARRLYVDAENWIMCRQKLAQGLSFLTACEAIGIDAAMLRRRLLDWKHTVRTLHRHRLASRLRLSVTPRERHLSGRRGRPPAAVRTPI